jgi:hypothetical protein
MVTSEFWKIEKSLETLGQNSRIGQTSQIDWIEAEIDGREAAGTRFNRTGKI